MSFMWQGMTEEGNAILGSVSLPRQQLTLMSDQCLLLRTRVPVQNCLPSPSRDGLIDDYRHRASRSPTTPRHWEPHPRRFMIVMPSRYHPKPAQSQPKNEGNDGNRNEGRSLMENKDLGGLNGGGSEQDQQKKRRFGLLAIEGNPILMVLYDN